MLVIQGLPRLSPVDTRRRIAPGGSGFALPASLADADPPGDGAPAGRIASLGGMLALQEAAELEAATPGLAHEGSVRDRAARQHGRSLLDALAKLQRDLLSGDPEPVALQALAGLSKAPPQAEDAGLRGLLAEVGLRVRIELARYGLA